MDDLRLAGLARNQGGVVSTAQLLACGLSSSGIRHRVRSSRLFPVRRGAYALSPHLDPHARSWAALLTVGAGRAALSHWTAAHLHGMSNGATPSRTIHLVVPGPGGRTGRDLKVHATTSLPAAEISMLDGLRMTSPARTVLDIACAAGDRSVRRLIREGEFLGLLPTGAMSRLVDAHPRHPGAARIRRVDPVTVDAALHQTPIEDDLDALLRTLPLPFPQRQVAVRGLSRATFRLDFGWPAVGLAIEADGRSAHERASALQADRFRDNDLAAVGWLTLRFTRSQILLGADDATTQIVATATNRGLRLTPRT